MKFFWGLCLGCCCILGVAFVIAILEAAAWGLVADISGCQFNFEILPLFVCGKGLVRYSAEFVLNLPFLFVYAPLFTLPFPADAPPDRTIMPLFYVFDVILILALTYPFLVLLARKRPKHSG
jgi:hypothetical protein